MVATQQIAESRLQLTSNTGARVKRVSHNGRNYLVAPASLIVPGVLNGSDGAGYYPLDEVVKNVKAWDDMPIVVYHPTKNGVPVAAQDPTHQRSVLRESGVGFLRNTRDVGKLASEAWFDEEYTQDYDQKLAPQHRIYPRLLRNESIELSTGLVVHKDWTPGVCPKTGRNYDWVARNHQPDHLAVLPDQRGACSVSDGCGVIMNTENAGKYQNPQDGDSGKFLPHGSGTGKGPVHQAVKKGFQSVLGAAEDGFEDTDGVEGPDMTENAEDGWVTLPNGVRIQIKDGEIVKGPDIGKKSSSGGKSDGGGIISDLEKRVSDLVGKIRGRKSGFKDGKPTSGEKDPLAAESDKLSGEIKDAVAKMSKSELQATLKSQLNLSKTPGWPKEKMAAAVHKNLYDRMGAAFRVGNQETTENTEDGWVTLPNGVHVQLKDGEIVKGPDISGGKTKKERQKENRKKDKDRGMPKEIAAAKARLEKFKDDYHPTDNQDQGPEDQAITNDGEFTMPLKAEQRAGLVAKIVANCQCNGGAVPTDLETLNKLSDVTLLQLNAMPEALAKAKAKTAPEDDEEEDEGEMPSGGKSTCNTVTNTTQEKIVANNQPISAKEWLEAAPPEIRSIVTNALETEREVKQDAINRLVANVADADKSAYTALYNGMDNKSLKMLVKAIPVQNASSDLDRLFAPVTYQGSTGGPEGGNRFTNNVEFDAPQGIPVTNWEEEEVASRRVRKQEQTSA